MWSNVGKVRRHRLKLLKFGCHCNTQIHKNFHKEIFFQFTTQVFYLCAFMCLVYSSCALTDWIINHILTYTLPRTPSPPVAAASITADCQCLCWDGTAWSLSAPRGEAFSFCCCLFLQFSLSVLWADARSPTNPSRLMREGLHVMAVFVRRVKARINQKVASAGVVTTSCCGKRLGTESSEPITPAAFAACS